MKEIVADQALVARCGLYCGACKSYLKGSCPGCAENVKASWCKVRSCCNERGYASCADCADHANPKDCKLFDNVFAKVIGFVLRSDRAACVAQIRALGLQGHAEDMASKRRQTIRR